MKNWIKYVTAASLALAAAGCSDDETITVYKPYTATVSYAEDAELKTSVSTGDKIWINGMACMIMGNGEINLHDVTPEIEYFAYYPEPLRREGSVLEYNLPATQTYTAGGVDKSIFPIYAFADNDQLEQGIELQPVLGALCLRIPTPPDESFASVSSIELKSGEYVLAGDVRIDARTGEVYILGNATQTLTMKGSIDTKAGADVLFVMPPLKFRDVLDVKITTTKGVASATLDLRGQQIECRKALVAELTDIDYPSTIYYGTANSVVVAPGTTSVKVDCAVHTTRSSVYAYENNNSVANESDLLAQSAKVLWNDVATGFISNVKLASDRKSFTATLSGEKGNAVVAICDKAGTILWSFHIWVTETADHDYGTNALGNHYVVMDRNLGATSATPYDARANGLLYEWGRKDPFPGGDAASSPTWIRPLYNESGTVARPKSQAGGASKEVPFAIANPMVYMMLANSKSSTSSKPYQYANDWLKYADDALWGNPEGYNNPSASTLSKSIYDPCPAGYMVAPNDVWLKDASTSIFPGTGWKKDESNKGLLFDYNGNSNIWYPAAGLYNRKTGNLQDCGVDGSTFKSCPVGGKDANGAYVIIKGDSPTATGKGNCRGNAYSVRCVKVK